MDQIKPPTITPQTTAKTKRRPHFMRRILFFLGIFGPGLIAANAGNDPGGIATYSSMGSQFGYQMLWVIPILMVGVAIVQEMCARMGAVTAQALSHLISATFPPPLTLFVMFLFP